MRGSSIKWGSERCGQAALPITKSTFCSSWVLYAAGVIGDRHLVTAKIFPRSSVQINWPSFNISLASMPVPYAADSFHLYDVAPSQTNLYIWFLAVLYICYYETQFKRCRWNMPPKPRSTRDRKIQSRELPDLCLIRRCGPDRNV